MFFHFFLNFLVFTATATFALNDFEYSVGVGIADVTGPAAQINMLGYAQIQQVTCGIHTRLWSRAFVIQRQHEKIVFVSIDVGMISQLLKSKVVEKLAEQFGSTFTESNVCLSSTHTHSGPGGFFKYFLYDITSFGFVNETFDAMLDGIVLSITRAHKNMQPAHIYYNQGNLSGSSINRSPASYLQNPEEERQQYETNVDTNMFLLKFTDLEGNGIGMINWFAVHGTSMNNTNCLISSDNKGYASLLFEREMNGADSFPGQGKFVAAFAQSNEGDVSPNTKGPICVDTGEPCDFETSTCHGRSEKCIGQGPGEDMFESTRIIGQMQYEKAVELWNSAEQRLSGPIKFIHRYVDMPNIELHDDNGKLALKGCSPAFGHSFAAGTTDGPGEFDFKQHTVAGNESVFWNLLSSIIFDHSNQLAKCQHPKPVLISQKSRPTLWMPEVVPVQLLRIGNLVLVAAPGEVTTMAGRRLRKAVHSEFSDETAQVFVVIAGLSNTYTSYITTKEEYKFQRYEGASTIFGPHTLDIYIHLFKDLASHLIKNETVSSVAAPSTDTSKLLKSSPFHLFDSAKGRGRVGKIIDDAEKVYKRGTTVRISFISSNPRNGIKLSSFVYVERFDVTEDEWTIVATDANWETRFYWRVTSSLLGQSKAIVYWTIPNDIKQGLYRIRFHGIRKGLMRYLIPYKGMSSNFMIDDSL